LTSENSPPGPSAAVIRNPRPFADQRSVCSRFRQVKRHPPLPNQRCSA